MAAPLTARADVRTDTPERCAKQLVSHLGHRVEFSTVGNVSTASIGSGVGSVEVGDGVLTLHASGRSWPWSGDAPRTRATRRADPGARRRGIPGLRSAHGR